MALPISRRGRLYVRKEAAYGAVEVLASTDAMRHVEVGLTFDPFQRVTSPEKKDSPGPVNRFDRRTLANLATLNVLFRPSGTLNTLPEADEILEAGMGAKTNVTLATTVNATTGTVGGATLASAAGLVVGDGLSIVVAGKRYLRKIVTLPGGGVVTWAPNLPSAPADGAAVNGIITYKLTTSLSISLVLAHYLFSNNFSRELRGVGIDQLQFLFDGTEEARLVASGPAQKQFTPAQAQPGAFTTVGGNPPTGMVGELRIGNTAYLHKMLELNLANAVVVRNEEAGNDGLATEVYRSGRREITATMEAFAETEATLYDLAEAGTNASLFRQNGWTSGNICAIYAPLVEWKVPETSDEDEATNWAFTGTLLESADGSNDELTVMVG